MGLRNHWFTELRQKVAVDSNLLKESNDGFYGKYGSNMINVIEFKKYFSWEISRG